MVLAIANTRLARHRLGAFAPGRQCETSARWWARIETDTHRPRIARRVARYARIARCVQRHTRVGRARIGEPGIREARIRCSSIGRFTRIHRERRLAIFAVGAIHRRTTLAARNDTRARETRLCGATTTVATGLLGRWATVAVEAQAAATFLVARAARCSGVRQHRGSHVGEGDDVVRVGSRGVADRCRAAPSVYARFAGRAVGRALAARRAGRGVVAARERKKGASEQDGPPAGKHVQACSNRRAGHGLRRGSRTTSKKGPESPAFLGPIVPAHGRVKASRVRGDHAGVGVHRSVPRISRASNGSVRMMSSSAQTPSSSQRPS